MWLPESETPEIDITGIKPKRAGPLRYGIFISEHVQTLEKKKKNPSKTLQAIAQQSSSFSYQTYLKAVFSLFPTVFIFPFLPYHRDPSLA